MIRLLISVAFALSRCNVGRGHVACAASSAGRHDYANPQSPPMQGPQPGTNQWYLPVPELPLLEANTWPMLGPQPNTNQWYLPV